MVGTRRPVCCANYSKKISVQTIYKEVAFVNGSWPFVTKTGGRSFRNFKKSGELQQRSLKQLTCLYLIFFSNRKTAFSLNMALKRIIPILFIWNVIWNGKAYSLRLIHTTFLNSGNADTIHGSYRLVLVTFHVHSKEIYISKNSDQFNKLYFLGRIVKLKKLTRTSQNKTSEVENRFIQCFPLYSVLMAWNQTNIGYLGFNIRDDELSILKTIPWNSVDIQVNYWNVPCDVIHLWTAPYFRSNIRGFNSNLAVYFNCEFK